MYSTKCSTENFHTNAHAPVRVRTHTHTHTHTHFSTVYNHVSHNIAEIYYYKYSCQCKELKLMGSLHEYMHRFKYEMAHICDYFTTTNENRGYYEETKLLCHT
jgi:hypothetical protein